MTRKKSQVAAAPWLPDGHGDAPGTWGLSAGFTNGLEHGSRFFSASFRWFLSREECRADRACRGCGRAPYDPHALMEPTRRPAGFARPAPRRGRVCGRGPARPAALTGSPRPLHSPFDSGGRASAAAGGRQTGNSGVNPGRPRRCVRAISGPGKPGPGGRAVAFEPLSRAPAHGRVREARRHAAVRARESEDLPGVVSLPDREGGRAGTAARAVGRRHSEGSAPVASPVRSLRARACGWLRGVGCPRAASAWNAGLARLAA